MHTHTRSRTPSRPTHRRPRIDFYAFNESVKVLVCDAGFPPFLARNILRWRAERGLSINVAGVVS
jgi:hypothetical protein